MNDATAVSDVASPVKPAPRRARGRLFLKYVALFLIVVSLALVSNGAFEV
jgi:hypothetical protein